MESKIIKFICKDKKHLLDFGILRREMHRFYMHNYNTPVCESTILKNLGFKLTNGEHVRITHCDSCIDTDLNDDYCFIVKFSDNVEATELKRILKLVYSIKYTNFSGKTKLLQYITVEPVKEDKNETI